MGEFQVRLLGYPAGNRLGGRLASPPARRRSRSSALNHRGPNADRADMEFNATSLNVTQMLVAALAVIAIVLVMRKRYDSNIPLLFYFVLIAFNNMTERETNPYLLYVGLVLAMLLRFEFMGGAFVKFVAFMTAACMVVITYIMVAEVVV